MMKPSALKSALFTALWTFIGLFGATLLGFIGQVMDWASANGHSAFPKTSVLGYAAVSAAGAAISGIVAGIVRGGQQAGFLPGQVPQFPVAPPAPPQQPLI